MEYNTRRAAQVTKTTRGTLDTSCKRTHPSRRLWLLRNRKISELQNNIVIVVYEKPTFGNGDPPFFDGRAQIETRGELKGVIINLCYDPRAKHFDTILNVIGLARTKFFAVIAINAFTSLININVQNLLKMLRFSSLFIRWHRFNKMREM